MEFLTNFGLYILAGMFISLTWIEGAMCYLSDNDRWRIPLTFSESIITIASVFTLAFFGGLVGIGITETYPTTNLAEAKTYAGVFSGLFSAPYACINSHWISNRHKECLRLNDDLKNFTAMYGRDSHICSKIRIRIAELKSQLLKDPNGYSYLN